MSGSSLDLNSDSYSTNEIETLLLLRTPYSEQDILKAKTALTQQLTLSSGSGNAEHNRRLLFFLDTITERLLQNKTLATPPTTLALTNTFATTPGQNYGSNFIIHHPDFQAGLEAKVGQGRIAADANAAPPGFMNPLNVRTIMQAISIDSRFRPNYFSSKSTNFHVVLPSIQKNVVSMRVASIELPTTFYAVSRSNGNSTCIITEVSNNASIDAWLLTLPDGNYEQSWALNSNAADIEAAMQQAIANAVPGKFNTTKNQFTIGGGNTTQLDNMDDLTFSVNRASGKAIFTAIANGIFDTDGFMLHFNVDPEGNLNDTTILQLRLGWQLGFRAASYQAKGHAVSEGICLVCGPRYGFISIDDYQKNTGPSYVIAYANSVLQDNIITRLNLAELVADFGVYQSSSDPGLTTQVNRTREYFGPVDIQRLHISLYDEFGRILDLNNMDWSLTLAFELLYT